MVLFFGFTQCPDVCPTTLAEMAQVVKELGDDGAKVQVLFVSVDPERDTRFTMGPMDVLDHSSRAFTYGSKMGIDATRKLPEEGFTRDWPAVIVMDDATKTSAGLATRLCGGRPT